MVRLPKRPLYLLIAAFLIFLFLLSYFIYQREFNYTYVGENIKYKKEGLHSLGTIGEQKINSVKGYVVIIDGSTFQLMFEGEKDWLSYVDGDDSFIVLSGLGRELPREIPLGEIKVGDYLLGSDVERKDDLWLTKGIFVFRENETP